MRITISHLTDERMDRREWVGFAATICVGSIGHIQAVRFHHHHVTHPTRGTR